MILEKKSVVEMEEKVQSLASLFEIDAILNKYPYNISGGQQQRTAVSRALVNEPSIILADEPTGNLDSKSSSIIMESFEKVVHTLSTTVLLVTHDIFAASYCDNVVFIKDIYDYYFINKAPKSTEKQDLNELIKFSLTTTSPIPTGIAIDIGNNEIYKNPRHTINGV